MVSDNSQVQLKNKHLHFIAHLEDSIHVQDLPESAPGYWRQLRANRLHFILHHCILILHFNRSVVLFYNCISSLGDFFLPPITACTVAGPCHPAMTLPQAVLSIPCWQSAVAEQGTKAAANKCCIQHSSPISPQCCSLQWLLHPASHTLCLLGCFYAKPQKEERGLGVCPISFS